jgi:S1-C subfamily serine protease
LFEVKIMRSENEATNAFDLHDTVALVPYESGRARTGRGALALFVSVMIIAVLLTAILCVVRRDISEENTEIDANIPAIETDIVDGWQGAFASAKISEECLSVCVSIRLGVTGGYSTPSATGMVISSDGWILTADKILGTAQTGRYYVKAYDGSEYAVMTLRRVEGTGLALMKIDAKDLAVARFADSDKMSAGQSAAAISSLGSPYHDLSIKGCILSGVLEAGTSYGKTKLWRTDIGFCDSELGSPVFDREGRVLGVALYQNEKFILPVDQIRAKIENME